MGSLLDLILVMMFLINFYVLGTTRIMAVLRAVGVQGVLLGIAPVLVHGSTPLLLLVLTVPAILLKGFFIPYMMLRALRNTEMKREVEPFFGFVPSMVAGALGTALAIIVSQRLPLAPEHAGTLIVPAALSTIVIGVSFFLVLLSQRLQRKAEA